MMSCSRCAIREAKKEGECPRCRFVRKYGLSFDYYADLMGLPNPNPRQEKILMKFRQLTDEGWMR